MTVVRIISLLSYKLTTCRIWTRLADALLLFHHVFHFLRATRHTATRQLPPHRATPSSKILLLKTYAPASITSYVFMLLAVWDLSYVQMWEEGSNGISAASWRVTAWRRTPVADTLIVTHNICYPPGIEQHSRQYAYT